MFFLGGFNSILPHLLYLTVIGVFMIIGFCGKFDYNPAPDKEPSITVHEIYFSGTSSSDLHSCLDIAVKPETGFSFSCSYIKPQLKDPPPGSLYFSIIDNRGPPILQTILYSF